MARIRTIKPEFFASLTIAELPLEARLTFIGLWTHADDEGRCVDDARLVKAALWPLDDRAASDVEQDLRVLSEHSLIARYEVGGRRFLQVSGWAEHQRINRPTASRFPSPEEAENAPADPPTEPSPLAHAQLSEPSPPEGKGTGKGREQGPPSGESSRTRSDRATRLPSRWKPEREEELQAQAASAGVDLHRELAKFRDYWFAKAGKDGRKVDWQATWRNWLRKAIDDRGGKAPPQLDNVHKIAAGEGGRW